MCRKITRLAFGVKCDWRGAAGSSATTTDPRAASARSISETMPGNSSELPASERMKPRREGWVTKAEFMIKF